MLMPLVSHNICHRGSFFQAAGRPKLNSGKEISKEYYPHCSSRLSRRLQRNFLSESCVCVLMHESASVLLDCDYISRTCCVLEYDQRVTRGEHTHRFTGTKTVTFMAEQVSQEMRDRGYRLCRDFLAGSWIKIEPCQFHIERMAWVSHVLCTITFGFSFRLSQTFVNKTAGHVADYDV